MLSAAITPIFCSIFAYSRKNQCILTLKSYCGKPILNTYVPFLYHQIAFFGVR